MMKEEGLDKDNERLFDLLETRDYEDLTAEEQLWLKQILSEEAYRERRKIITQSRFAFMDTVQAVPAPLVMRTPNSASFLRKQVPLYQVLIGAAALITLFLLTVPFFYPSTEIVQEKVLVEHDTIVTEKEIHDTVILEKTRPVIVEKIVQVQSPNVSGCGHEELRLLETGVVNAPPISVEQLRNKGRSLKEDETAALLPDISTIIQQAP